MGGLWDEIAIGMKCNEGMIEMIVIKVEMIYKL